MNHRLPATALAFALLALFAGACSNSDPGGQTCGDRGVVLTAPAGATEQGPASGDERLRVAVALEQKQSAGDYEALVTRVTRADAPERSQPPSMREVAETWGATAQAVDTVTAFFAGFGLVPVVDPTRTFASVEMDVATASRIFAVDFARYGDDRGRCGDPAGCRFVAPRDGATLVVPAELAAATPDPCAAEDHVKGLSSRVVFTRLATSRSAAASTGGGDPAWSQPTGHPDPESVCEAALAGAQGFTPDQLRTAYGYPDAPMRSAQTAAVLELGGGICQSAMDGHTLCFKLPRTPVQGILPDGTPLPSDEAECSAGEPMLDATTLASFAPGLAGLYWVAAAGSGADFAAALSRLVSLEDANGRPVRVVSISVQSCEAELASDFDTTLTLANAILMRAAHAGVSVITAAGDNGSTDCNGSALPLSVSFPSSSPWVTAVGGTHLELTGDNQVMETGVWNDSVVPGWYQESATGGGASGESVTGFSGFPLPGWQSDVGITGATRQLPDVATYADIYPGVIYYGGSWQSASGTSFAAPLFAAAILRYNDATGRNMGFANPLLYTAWHEGKLEVWDIASGNNEIYLPTGPTGAGPLAPLTTACCEAGPGFDMASGIGTVKVDSLLAYRP